MRPALLLVDLQADFLNAPGLEPAATSVVRQAARLLRAARAAGAPVIHVVTSIEADGRDSMPHWRSRGRFRCVRGTPGHASPSEVSARTGEMTFSKTFFSAFSAPGLDRALVETRADTLIVAGVHLHGCVRATVLDAYQRGLDVRVAEDAVGSDDPLHAAVTRRYLETRAARFMPVGALEAVLFGRDPEPLAHFSPSRLAERLFTVPVGGAGDTAAAALAARSAGETWRHLASTERARLLEAVAARFEIEAAPLARQAAVELGKPVSQGHAEVRRTGELIRRAASLGLPGVERCGPESASRRLSVGVVALITPWNNPFAIPWGKIAAALALGNTIVWKPSPPATRAAARSLELAADAGLPADAVRIVTGDDRTAAALMSDPAVDAVSLTGSSAAGWAAQEACASRRIPLQAELGGNNAAIVWTGADLARAAALVAKGAFLFAGQRCTANRRVIVGADRLEEFLEILTSAVASLVWGDPLDPRTDIGPLVSRQARERVRAAIDTAAGSAEEVRVPHGEASFPGASEGAYAPPTLVVAPPHESEIVQQETFGPVLVVERASDFDEALALAGGVPQGLVSALFAGPGPWRERFLERTRAGVLKWNASTADADAFAPFGGWKGSGVGPPERGTGDLEFYSRAQALYGAIEE